MTADETPPNRRQHSPVNADGGASGGGDSASKRHIVLRVLRFYLRPQIRLLLLTIGANLVVAGSTALLPWLVNLSIEGIFQNSQKHLLYLLPLAVFAAMLLKSLSTYGARMAAGHIHLRMAAQLERELAANLIRSDMARVEGAHSGDFLSRFMNDIPELCKSMGVSLLNLTQHLLTVIGLYGSMLYLSWRLGLLMTLVLPVIVYFLARQGRRARSASRERLEESGAFSVHVAELLRALRVIKTYAREAYEITRAEGAIRRLKHREYVAMRVRVAAAPLVEALAGMGVAGIIFYGGLLHFQGSLSLAEFTGFIAALMLVYQPLRALAGQHVLLHEGIAAAERIFRLLDERPKLLDAANAKPLRLRAPNCAELRFENIRFHYPASHASARLRGERGAEPPEKESEPVLRGVTLTAAAGKTTALVGASGAGKSSLLNLVPRLFDPQDGRILIDEQDTSEVPLAQLRAAIAVVTQQPVLFDDSVRANIAYGRAGASDAEIEAAAREASAHEFITALPQGYDTRVGEGGQLLSGGQRQAVAIARAMLKDAPILLLDEATASLDSVWEERVRASLERLMRARTVLVIAHRLATVARADYICVLDQGRIVEEGSHEELLSRNGFYTALARTQLLSAPESAPESEPEQ